MAFQSNATQSGAFQQTNPQDPVGSMCYGQRYYGQGFSDANAVTLHTISATVTVTATLIDLILITKLITATVTTTAAITKGFFRTILATVTATATRSGGIVRALNIRKATTKFLALPATSRAITGLRSAVSLNLSGTTKQTTDD